MLVIDLHVHDITDKCASYSYQTYSDIEQETVRLI